MVRETVRSGFNGIYEPAQMAKYLFATSDFHVSSHHILNWVREGLALAELSEVPSRQLLLTFEDLITFRMIVIFRKAGFSLRHIIKVERYFQTVTGEPRPFATKRFWIGTRDLFSELYGRLVSGSKGGQQAFDFIRSSLKEVELTFNEQGIASRWLVRPHVSLQPIIQFGEPCIDGTRIPTGTVWGMFKAGDSEPFLARCFKVKPQEISEAIAWERKLEEVA